MRRLFRVVAVAAPFFAVAGGAVAEPCSGTLCDLFHGSSDDSAAAAAPAEPHVMTVPTNPLANWFGHNDSSSDAQPSGTAAQSQPAQQPTTYDNGFFHMGGGGVANRNGNQDCGGTICDLLHGHSSSDEAEPSTIQDINGTPRSSSDRAADAPTSQPAAAAVARESATAAPVSGSRAATIAYARPAPLPATAPSCAHSAKDPWSCYRR